MGTSEAHTSTGDETMLSALLRNNTFKDRTRQLAVRLNRGSGWVVRGAL